MSVNITKHGSTKKCPRNVLLDPERTKKEGFDERRKQRLLQVRSQSKELAFQVRQKVNLENKKQLKRIEQIKEQELKKTKIKQHKKDDDISFLEFGEAHRAAELENNLKTTPIKRPSCPITHDRNYSTIYSQISNKNAKNIDKENLSFKANAQHNNHIYPNILIDNRKSKKLDPGKDSTHSDSPRKAHNLLSKSLKTHHATLGGCCFLPICCCCHPILACQCHLNTNCNCSKKNYSKNKYNSGEDDNEKYETAETASTTSTITSSSETKPISSYTSFKKKQQQRQNAKNLTNTKNLTATAKLTKTPSVIMEVSSEESDSSSSSSCIIEDTHSNDNMLFSRVYSRTGRKNETTSFKYNAKDFEATTDPSSESINVVAPKSPIDKSLNESRRTKPKSSLHIKPTLPSLSKSTTTLSTNNPKSDVHNKSQLSFALHSKYQPPRARFTEISDLLKQNRIEQNISSDLLSTDKSTQITPRNILLDIPEEGIAKDFCTRGTLVDSNELAKNQFQNQNNINKIITESQNSLVNDRIQQVQKKNIQTQKSPRKIIKNVNIGQKRQECPKIGELLGPKSILGSKTIPKQTLKEKVQYYDYNNRFQKQYHPKLNKLIQNDRNNSQLNAMENANIEKQLQRTKDSELELLRKKSEERCHEAIEREQVRRDYEALQTKLDALSMDKKTGRNIFQPQDDNIFSDIRLKQLATVRQNKINNAVESILQQPIVITCPEVNPNVPSSSNRQNDMRSNEQTYQNEINVGNNYNTENILNSSDSCGSILLNYVDKRTEEISNDIKISSNNEKNCKLKSLLNRLNLLKVDLVNELQSNQKNNQNSTVENAFETINEMNKEHKKIMTLNKEKTNLEKREKRLKKQEAILEKKLKEFFEIQKSSNKLSDKSESIDSVEGNKNTSSEESTESSICLGTKTISTKIAKQPIEIIIQVTDTNKKKVKSPSRTPRQKASLFDPMKRKKKLNIQKISTPIRSDNEEMKIVEPRDENNSQTTSSTVYRSLPKCVENNLNKLLNEHNKQKPEIQNIIEEKQIHKEYQKKISPAKRIVTPKKLSKPVKKSKITISKISDKREPRESCSKEVISQQPLSSSVKKVEKTINPILGHYIQRLLGMSRQSINMLGVSSSTVTTPNSSLINNSANRSNIIDSNYEKERIERLQRFIDDNYSFLSELEESLKTSGSSSLINSSEASQKAFAEIWQKTLKKKSEANINKEDDCTQKPPKPILKKLSDNLKTIKTSSQNDNAKLEVLGKYTELTATCAQRIAELNKMINRVRQEKQKILEITLSSNSTTNTENGKNSTEYLEFADKTKQQQAQSTGGRTYVANVGTHNSSRITQITNNENLEDAATDIDKISDRNYSPNPETIVRVPEIDICENMQLEKNKLTGISRDSGISLSRPVTALGSRDSPDTRRDSKTEDTVIFEPLLKDIPKPNSMNLLPCKSHLANTISDKLSKKPNKPPVALTRFSPQLIEEIPHELSTIIEIDTPGTSRLNALTKHLSTDENIEITEENNDQILLPLNDNECQDLLDDIEIDFKKFPTFEEYAKKHNLDLTSFDSELNLHMQKEYQKILELSQSLKEMKYNDYQSPGDYMNTKNELSELISIMDICDDPNNGINFINSEESLKKLQPKFNNFPTAKEYFKKVGAKDFINSSSLDNISISTNDIKTFTDEKCTLTSPCESLPDVNAELKRRNIMQHSFINQYQKSDEKDGTSDDLNSISSNSKDNKKQKNNTEKYPMSGLEQFTSTTTTSKTEEIEKDLENMGMKWAQVMLKKTQRSQALSSSTASSFLFEKHLRPSPFRKSVNGDFTDGKKLKSSTRIDMEKEIDNSSDTSANTEYGGKPLNLREFLTQELQKRTNSSASSSSVADDSMVNLFLRSLLGSVTPSSYKQTDRKQKTSTPVGTLSKSQSSSIKNNSKGSQGTTNDSMKLFSGESGLSSVRFSRSDCEKSVDNNFKNSNNKQNDEKNNKFKNTSL